MEEQICLILLLPFPQVCRSVPSELFGSAVTAAPLAAGAHGIRMQLLLGFALGPVVRAHLEVVPHVRAEVQQRPPGEGRVAQSKRGTSGGGCGGGANVKPIAFLVVGNGSIKLLPVTPESSPVNKIIDMVPDVIEKVNDVLSDLTCKKKEENSSGEQTDTVDSAE